MEPFWIGERGGLLGIPSTGAYVGWLGRASHRVFEWSENPACNKLRAQAILSRLRALDRLRLSPEGYTLEENIRLTKALLGRGVRVCCFTFHSPSLDPGCTGYVRDTRELDKFLGCCRGYFEFFLGKLGGIAMTPLELKEHILSHTP